MAGWSSKCRNENGEYEIKFHTKDYNEYRRVEKLCQKIMDKHEVKSRKSKKNVEKSAWEF